MGNRNSGPRPQPTALKVLRGNPGRRPLNKAEPQPPAGEVQRPAHLSQMAAVVWDELAPPCIAMRTLTVADTAAFGKLCELEATARAASAQKDAEGFRVFGADGSVHSAIRLERETALALRSYYERFGLEPSARSRIRVPKPEAPVSKWAGMGIV